MSPIIPIENENQSTENDTQITDSVVIVARAPNEESETFSSLRHNEEQQQPQEQQQQQHIPQRTSDGYDSDPIRTPIDHVVITDAQTPISTHSDSTTTVAPLERTDSIQHPTIDEANEEIALLLKSNKISQNQVVHLQTILRENTVLKDKITKLKALLAKSSKATRDVKNELDTHKKALDVAHAEMDKLHQRLMIVSNRPTHMDLLVDFDTKFEKALLSVQSVTVNTQHATTGGISYFQSGGEDPSSAHTTSYNANSNTTTNLSFDEDTHRKDGMTKSSSLVQHNQLNSNMNANVHHSLLVTELSEIKERYHKLESLNEALLQRASLLEQENESLHQEQEKDKSIIAGLQSQLRMAQLEAKDATRAMNDMQLELELVTQSAVDASARAVQGRKAVETVASDKAVIESLRIQNAALQEWAIAAATAKEVIVEKNVELEHRWMQVLSHVRNEGTRSGHVDDIAHRIMSLTSTHVPESEEKVVMESLPLNPSVSTDFLYPMERQIWNRNSSVIIGAGSSHQEIVEFGHHKIKENEAVVLRWKFDILPQDLDIVFGIVRGRCQDRTSTKHADSIVHERTVIAGAGGENEGVFTLQNACTLLFSNEQAWVKPRVINFSLEVYAIV